MKAKNQASSDCSLLPVVPKALRNEFYRVLIVFFVLGAGIPYILSNFLRTPCEALYVYREPILIAISLPIALFLQSLLFRTTNYRAQGVLLGAFILLSDQMCRWHQYTGDADEFIITGFLMLYSLLMLLNFARSYAMALGPKPTAAKRLLAVECVVPLASLLGLALLLTPEKMHAHIFNAPGYLLMFAFAFGAKPDIKPWQLNEEGDIRRAEISHERSVGAALLYAAICVTQSFASVLFIKRVGVMAELIPYAAGIAAVVLLSRVIAIKLVSTAKLVRGLACALIGGILAGLSCAVPSLGLSLIFHYGALLLAFALVAPCGSILLAWATEDMSEKRSNIYLTLWGSILLLSILVALSQLRSGLPDCGHLGCAGG